jgi:hypothetical protein
VTTIDFGKAPTEDAPTKGGPFVWVGDAWVPVATDTGDGVDEELDLSGTETEKTSAALVAIPLRVGNRVYPARVLMGKNSFNPSQKRAPDGKWTDGGGWSKKPGADDITDADLIKSKPWVKGDRGVGAPGVIYTDEAELTAFKLLDNYAKAEPEITSALAKVAKANQGHMEGLEFRLKGQESLARKIEQKSATKGLTMKQYAAKIGDALRYTMIVPPGRYGEGSQATIDDFRKQGYEVEVENTWRPGSPYKGINTNMKKDGVIFEVQFHTPESFDLKMDAHVLYEKARDTTASPEERAAATKKMIDNAEAMPTPSGAADVK